MDYTAGIGLHFTEVRKSWTEVREVRATQIRLVLCHFVQDIDRDLNRRLPSLQ
jgi:hypothetical protein